MIYYLTFTWNLKNSDVHDVDLVVLFTLCFGATLWLTWMFWAALQSLLIHLEVFLFSFLFVFCTLLPAKREDNKRETEPIASTSAASMKTRAELKNCGASKKPPGVVRVPSPNSSSESDTDDSGETSEDQPPKSHNKTRVAGGKRLYLRKKLSPGTTSVRRPPSMSAYSMERAFSCTVCGRTFNRNGNLKRHTRIHRWEALKSVVYFVARALVLVEAHIWVALDWKHLLNA